MSLQSDTSTCSRQIGLEGKYKEIVEGTLQLDYPPLKISKATSYEIYKELLLDKIDYTLNLVSTILLIPGS